MEEFGVEEGVGIGRTRATIAFFPRFRRPCFFNLDLFSKNSPPFVALLQKKTTQKKKKKKVWKTYLGRNRGTGTLEAVGEIYRNGGVSAFWAGTGAKMVESASKGLILMYSKESLLRVFEKAHVSPGEDVYVSVWRRRGGGGGRERETERAGLPRRASTRPPLTKKNGDDEKIYYPAIPR